MERNQRCSICRKSLRQRRGGAKTCSSPCRQKAYRHRVTVTRKAELSATQGVTDNVHFRHLTDLWETPPEVFDALNHEFGFTLDVCALPHNAKCAAFYSPAENGLVQPWEGVCWLNPPYGREIIQWVAKAHASALAGAVVVALLPARTDTIWWQTYVTHAAEVRFLRGRVRFSGGKHGAPFPSAVVVFRAR